ncbi:alpha/beta fold hydrolase [Kitasatospora sp. NPDC088391]|uniref:alpha/beta fold hydrolase n=1 Tax=Kitasatospora sp. NPDC088391 TaxID=3364074 RepID=UPI0037FAF56A
MTAGGAVPVRHQEFRVEVPGGVLHAVRSGRGPDVVLLNAGATDARMWAAEAEALAGRHRVTRYDDRGTGPHSTAPTGPWTYTADLLAVLDALGIGRAVLIGASDGGRKALDAALAHPERVAGLVLVGAAMHLPDLTEAEQPLYEELIAALRPRAEAVERGDLEAAIAVDLDVWCPRATPVVRAALTELYRASPAFLLGLPHPPEEPAHTGIAHLDRIDAPALVLTGEHDTPFTHLCHRRLAAGLPRVRAEVVPGADHLVNLSRPAEFARRVTAFLGGLRGGALDGSVDGSVDGSGAGWGLHPWPVAGLSSPAAPGTGSAAGPGAR